MGTPKWGTALVWCIAFVAGGVAAFMTAGPVLFADGGTGERLIVLGVSVVAFGLIGLGAGAAAPYAWKGAGIAAAFLPVVLVAVVFGLEMPLLATVFVVSDAAAGLFGAWLGAKLRLRRVSA